MSIGTASPQLVVRKEQKLDWLDQTDRWCTEVWPQVSVFITTIINGNKFDDNGHDDDENVYFDNKGL